MFNGLFKSQRSWLFLLLSVAWVAIGFLSDSVHGLSTDFWVMLTAMIGGASLAVARWGTLTSIRVYVFLVASAGVISSVSLGGVGRYRASAVWAVILIQSVLIGWYAHRYRVEDHRDADESA